MKNRISVMGHILGQGDRRLAVLFSSNSASPSLPKPKLGHSTALITTFDARAAQSFLNAFPFLQRILGQVQEDIRNVTDKTMSNDANIKKLRSEINELMTNNDKRTNTKRSPKEKKSTGL